MHCSMMLSLGVRHAQRPLNYGTHPAISHFGEVLRVLIALGTRQVGAIKQTKKCFLNDAVYGCV